MSIYMQKDGICILVLPGKSYKSSRIIGQIIGDEFHCKRNPVKHLFKELNAYGFCLQLMREYIFKKVIVHLPSGETLETSRHHILKRGFIRNFKNNKLEEQIFLPLEEFGQEDTADELVIEPPEPSDLQWSQGIDQSSSTEDERQTGGEQLSLFGGTE